MNVIESIYDINSTIREADEAVLESMMNIIDKREMISECDNETLDEMFVESMMYFVEYTAKDKDEITKWMAKNGYWYDGDNPNKKKKCMRMYHFLKQHDFNPSDETYQTNAIDKNGNKKRIPMKFDRNAVTTKLTDEDKKLLQEMIDKKAIIKNGAGEMTPDMRKLPYDEDNMIGSMLKYATVLGKVAVGNMLQEGKNSFYDPDNNEVALSSKLIKGKQSMSQFLSAHEEGHANDFSGKKQGTTPENKAEIAKGKREAREYKYKTEGKGLHMNMHDKQSIEGYADKYGVQNAQIRNKNAGKKHAKKTRNINNNEIKHALQIIDNIVTDKGMNIKPEHLSDPIKAQINAIDTFLKTGEETSGLVEIPNYERIKDFLNSRDQTAKAVSLIMDNADEIDSDISKGKSFEEIGTKLLDSLRKHDIDEDGFDFLEKVIDDSILLHRSVKDMVKIRVGDESSYDRKMKRLLSTIKTFEDIWTSRNNKPGSSLYTPRVIITADEFESIINKNNKDNKKIMADIDAKINKGLTDIKNKLTKIVNIIDNEAKLMGSFKDLSTHLRYKFASKYVKEYFDDLFDDACITE